MSSPPSRKHSARRADTAVRGPLHLANRLRAARRSVRGLDATLRRPGTYRHPAGRIVRIETHISVVYLAGRFAYKIIKPVAPGFADFTSTATRERCCEAQLRLNRPLAQGIYAGVLPIARHHGVLALGADGTAVEHVVRMRRFDEAMLFSSLAANGALTPRDIDGAAKRLADYHLRAPRNAPSSRYGSASLVRAQIETITAALLANCSHPALPGMAAWCARQLDELAPLIERRRAEGFVRGCHGDLHLDNVVRWRGAIAMFDCIDFDDALRWIDVAADVAFLVMDLGARAEPRLANRLLNRWLETSGDYAALSLLPLYVAYRALVRAWVACLKAGHLAGSDVAIPRPALRYLELARAQTQRPGPVLLLCHGYSGSGKSVASRALADLCGAVRVSSDAERKRRLPPPDEQAALGAEHYTQAARHAIYGHLLRLAHDVLQSGHSAIVDATFLEFRHRGTFLALAERLGVPARILDFRAEPAVLAQRIEARRQGPRDLSDADTATLARQLASADALTPAERALSLSFDTAVPIAAFDTPAYWRPVLDLMQARMESVTFASPVTCRT
ncbi:aminoglycoside phosphotransferase [Paraburkholderia sp. UYCP14C]|uniref:bifunctional aminoglycoside phosphotransferase/ATP-binding protein n=1 Tax=Paraburkholderia sp. UYCP14C TaxID=2511130 RepID=UPI001021371C|nr:bifunctional aminoglycoside phosphotransferase/ATP-binding protein [Paraburkholderia sp. UYCP14C]RZF25687.1 aminoglycoside phosphotransferase [Paraburkholderia sp. UYCP14C]